MITSKKMEEKDFFAKIDQQTQTSPPQQQNDEYKNVGSSFSPPSSFEPSVPFQGSAPIPVDKKGKFLKIAAILLFFGILFLFIGWLAPRVKKGGEINLVYWGLWEPESVMNQIIVEYQKNHPKVKINYIMQSPKDYRERLGLAITRGEGPDIFRFHNTWVPMFQEILSPVPSSVMDSSTFEKTFYPTVKSDLRVGSSYVGIPLEIDNLALFINEEIFNNAGVNPPTTWDEFRKIALQLTVKDSLGKIQSAGAALGITSNVDHWSDILGLMLFQNSANPAKPIDNLAEDALSFYTQFYRVDKIWDESLPSSTYYFASGRLAMYFGYSWRVFDIKNLNPSLKFKILPVPQLPGVNINWASYWVEGVSKKSPYQTQAWEFLKYLSSKETMEKLYQIQSKVRLFGEPYSRVDMAHLLRNEPYVGTFINQAQTAKSWYLCSRTFDNGINDKIIKYYENAVNAVNKGNSVKSELSTVANGIAQILGQYGVK